MIVDIHTRIWESSEQLGRAAEQLRRWRTEPWNRPTASTDEHDQAMEPVQNAIILGFESQMLGALISHEKVAAYVQRKPDKYIGFAGIDPTAGSAVKSFERAVSLGLQGVVISPAAQGVHPTDTRIMDLYEACEAKGLPVFIDPAPLLARDSKMEFSQPLLFDEVARTFPNLKLVLSSLGHPWVEQGLALIGKHPSVYGDLGELIMRPWQLYNALVLAHQYGVMGQLLFGSNFPFFSPEQAIVSIYSVNTLAQGTHLPSVPREQLRSIVERDALNCLGLAATTTSNRPTDAPASTPQANPEEPTPAAAEESNQ